MSSDEEDFNDIYGDDNVEVTSNTADATKEVTENRTEEPKKTEQTETKPEEKKEQASSSLDQLAALQALSSNLNQLNNNNSNESNNNDSSNVTSNNTNQYVDSNNTSNTTQQSNSQSNSTQNNTAQNNTTTNTAGGSGLPWEQLQQTMSQFQQPEHVKADISKDNCKMFIGGLNWETTEENLKDYFTKYGEVIELKIMKDPNTGRSRGFGFLTFNDPKSVDEVVRTQHVLDGKVIDPKRSIPREEQDKTGKIFVGGIGADVRPKEFEEFFLQYGSIIDAQLMLDKDTGRSRGFGFVTYDSPEAVDRVCQSKYIEFKGKQIEIKRAQPRHLQKGQYGGANPNNRNLLRNGGPSAGPMNTVDSNMTMFQNPMMAGSFNPMATAGAGAGNFNPQAMQEYYQKMQEYYQQMQQQTGMDYSQMYQQQMQQMAMMMPGFQMPPQGMGTPQMPMTNDSNDNNSNDNDNNNSGNNSNNDNGNVQTIGMDDKLNDKKNHSPDINLPRGPRDPNSLPPHNNHNQYRDRGDRGDRYDRNEDRRSHRGFRNNNNNNGNHRNGGGYRGNRSGYGKRNNNNYHPYNRS